MDRSAKRFYEFGTFRLDADERRLLRDGDELPLTPKVFDLLLLLVENNRHTLAKHELLDRIWEGSFVEENSLSRNISILRKTLATSTDEDGYIKTVPKLGYRFDADVRAVLEDEEELVVERRTRYSIQLDSKKPKEGVSKSRTTRIALFGLAFAAVVAVGVITMLISRPEARSGGLHTLAATPDPEANDLYRRGRELWQTRSAAGLHQAILLLEQSIDRDPNFALAHSALADAYAFDARFWIKAEPTARRAMELDPDLGNPHATIGFVRLFWEWDTRQAEDEFRQAIASSPDYATAHQWYAISLAIVGQYNEAHEEMKRALELEPNSAAVNADMCHVLYMLHRYEEAEAQCKKTLRLNPTSHNAHSVLYWIYTASGKYNEAVTTFLARETLTEGHAALPEDLRSLQQAFDAGGISGFWRKRLEFLREPGGSVYDQARYHALLADDDAAMLELERSCRSRDFGFIFFFGEPIFHRFVDDPRYEELAAKLINGQIASACGDLNN